MPVEAVGADGLDEHPRIPRQIEIEIASALQFIVIL